MFACFMSLKDKEQWIFKWEIEKLDNNVHACGDATKQDELEVQIYITTYHI